MTQLKQQTKQQMTQETKQQMSKQTFQQMSESYTMGALLAITGGFLDAYTYICRGKVFANAQTGNVALLGMNLAEGNWNMAIRYLIPILAFIAGVFVAEVIKLYFKKKNRFHWRQIIVIFQILLLCVVAFLPQNLNMLANVTVSFVCALQAQSFRKIKGNVCSTTMCTGNLRSATEFFCLYRQNGDVKLKKKSIWYYAVDVLFVLGAIVGTLFTKNLLEKAILLAGGVLCIAFIIMFIQNDDEL